MSDAQERLNIIKAIEGASAAELEQLTQIRQTLKTLGNASGTRDSSSGTSPLTIKRPLRRGPEGEKNKTESDYKDDKYSHIKDKMGRRNPYVERVPRKRTKSVSENSNSPLKKDNKRIQGSVRPNGSFKKDKNNTDSNQERNRNERVRPVSDAGKNADHGTGTSNGRDANGRFTSKAAASDVAEARNRKAAQRVEDKRQQNFFRSLTGIMEHSIGSKSDAMSSGADFAGTAAGGPLWMAGKGLYDIGAEVSSNVVTLKKWMDNQTAGNTALKPEPAITFPPVSEKARPAPALGNPGSAAEYKEAQQARSVAVTEAQTKVIAANDEKIIKGVDDVREEIRKLAHSSRGDAGGGGLLDSLLPGRRKRRNKGMRRPHKRGLLSTADEAIDVAGDLTPDGKNKTDGKDPKKKPAAKKKGLLGKALDVLKGGKKAAIAAGGAAAAAATGAVVAGAGAAEGKAAEKATVSASGKATEKASEKVAAATTEKTTEKAAATATEKAADKTGLKVAGKVAGKTALKAIPIVGTALGAGLDAYEGYNDEEGQRAAFNVKDGQKVTGKQKAAYTSANVINMGGLVSGASGLLASGASALGLDGVAKSLTFDTGDIAKGLDSGLSKVGDMFSAFTGDVAGVYDKLTGSSSDQTKAIKEGADQTVNAINQLGLQLQGGEWGKDGVGSQGKSVNDYNDVTKNNIGADLNIGGDKAKVRSFRNNNFGNLNFVGQEGASLEATPGNGKARFAKFNTPEEGFRALANQLSLYSEGKSKAAGYKKLNSVEDIISLYAPKSENNTSQYIDSLSKKMGVKASDQLNLKDPKVMTQLMRGIATIEGGNPQVSNDWIQKAIGHNEDGKWVGGQLSEESLKVVNEARAKQGAAPIAADSLYTAGNKVKLAQPGATANARASATTAGSTTPAKQNQTSASAPAGQANSAAAAIHAAETGQVNTVPAAPGNALGKAAETVHAAETGQVKPVPAAPDNALGKAAEAIHAAEISNVAPAPVAPGNPLAQAAAAVHAAQNGQAIPEPTAPASSLSQQIAAVAQAKAEEGTDAGATVTGMTKIGAIAGLNKKADGWIQGAAESMGVEGMAKRRPDSGLSLPAGASLPAGLQLAALSPDKIAAHSRPSAPPGASFGSVEARPASATATPRQMVDGVPVFDASEINKARPVSGSSSAVAADPAKDSGGGLFDRVLGGAMNGVKAVGASVMPAVGDTFSQALGGFSGSDMISGVLQQAGVSDPGLMRAVSPLTSKAGSWLDSGVSSIASAGKSLLSGGTQASSQSAMQPPLLSHPKNMQNVTDLARSGVRPMMNGDNGKHDPDMLKEIKRLGNLFEEMLGITKKKSDITPDKVVNSAQPAPRQSSTLSVSDSALNDILQD